MKFRKISIAALPLAAFLFTAPVSFAHELETHGAVHQELNAEHGAGHEELNAEHGNAHENLEAEHEAAHQYPMTARQHRRLHRRLELHNELNAEHGNYHGN
jgi:hypothetical protein